MERIFTVHNENNSLNFLTAEAAVAAIFRHHVDCKRLNRTPRIHMTSRMGNPLECTDFYE